MYKLVFRGIKNFVACGVMESLHIDSFHLYFTHQIYENFQNRKMEGKQTNKHKKSLI